MNFFEKAKNILRFAVDCLFPRCCIICSEKVDGDKYCNLCSHCVAHIPWIGNQKCSICSRPMGEEKDAKGEKLVCSECRECPPPFKSGMACWLYKGVGRDIILTLKYRHADFLQNDIANLLKNHWPSVREFTENSILVPVPTHYFRRLGRGYNQTEVISNAIVKITSGAKVVSMLRSKHKKSQTKLKKAERLLNIKNMFEYSSAGSISDKNLRIVVVDDILTTGATLRECCTVLQRAGFNNLHVLTLAYG